MTLAAIVVVCIAALLWAVRMERRDRVSDRWLRERTYVAGVQGDEGHWPMRASLTAIPFEPVRTERQARSAARVQRTV